MSTQCEWFVHDLYMVCVCVSNDFVWCCMILYDCVWILNDFVRFVYVCLCLSSYFLVLKKDSYIEDNALTPTNWRLIRWLLLCICISYHAHYNDNIVHIIMLVTTIISCAAHCYDGIMPIIMPITMIMPCPLLWWSYAYDSAYSYANIVHTIKVLCIVLCVCLWP